MSAKIKAGIAVLLKAGRVGKGEGDGDFRGGDPEELQLKREEKREEQEATGEADDLLRSMLELTKAEAGSESGEFRGGDPEELQRKREEKREELEESGEKDLQEEEAAMQLEEAGGEAAVADEAAMEAEAEGDAAKSAGPFAAFQVSPVDTLEDYQPRTWNGDPLDTQPNQPPPAIAPSPIRDEKNKQQPWSEVVGFKVPKEGAPWQYLRRFIFAGQPEKVMEEGAKILKSWGTLEKAFLDHYRWLQSDVTFDPVHQILEKAHKGEVIPGHLYVYREMGPDGSWKYTYTNGVHGSHHGFEHSGHQGGHTVPVHPDWHGDAVPTGSDPTLENPKAAFDHARQKRLEEPGRLRVMIKDPNSWNDEKQDFDEVPHILHIKGPNKRGNLDRSPMELHTDPTGGVEEDLDKIKLGKTTKLDKSPSKWGSFEDHIRRNHVNTVFDIHGNPFMQYMEPKIRAKDEGETTRGVDKDRQELLSKLSEGGINKRSDLKDLTKEDFSALGVSRDEAWDLLGERSRAKGEQRGRLRVRYMTHSPHSREVKRKGKTIGVGEWHQGSENVQAFQNMIRKEKQAQRREAGLDTGEDKKKRLLKPRNDPDFEWTDKVEQDGVPRRRIEVPYMAPTEGVQEEISGETGKAPEAAESERRVGQRKVWQVHFPDKKTHEKFVTRLTKEHEGLSHAIGAYLIDHLVNKRRPEKMYKLRSKTRDNVVEALTKRTITRAITQALHNYDPRQGKRFGTYLFNYLMNGQKRVLADTIKLHENVEMGSGKEIGGEAGEQAGDRQRARSHAIEAGTGAPDADHGEAGDYVDRHLAKLKHMGETTHTALQSMQSMPAPTDPKHAEGHQKMMQAFEHKVAAIVGAGRHLAEIKTGMMEGTGHPLDVNDWHDKWSDPRHGLTDDPAHPVLEELPHTEEARRHIQRKLYKAGKTEKAVKALSKAQEGFPQADQQAQQLDQTEGGTPADGPGEASPEDMLRQYPDANYVGRVGEPGAYRYLYEAGEGGNIVHGTNAPPDHEEHVPELGDPSIHDHEPSPETHPNLFDEQGRKLHAPIPPNAEDVEDNPDYSPEKVTGNHWVKRYTDPDSGSKRYAYLHRDQVTDPKMHRNNAIRYVDAQLPKIRAHYHQRLVSDSPADRAVGLFLALLDQAKLPVDALENLEVEDVKISGNVVTFHIGMGKARAVMDNQVLQVLQELMQDKEPNDVLFAMDGGAIDLVTLNRFMQSQFGVLPSDLETYNNTELFSREFQKLVQRKDMEYTVRHLQELRSEAVQNVAKMTGNDPHTVERYIDPIAVEAMFLAAAAKRYQVAKAQGACEQCGEPRGHCEHTRKKDKLSKSYKLQGRTEFQGLKISIENKAGSVRKWYDPHNKQSGETKMRFDYGYILGSMGTDGDHVDVYLGPNQEAKTAYVVHQMKAPDFTKFDEDKVFLGWDDPKQVEKDYKKQYDNPRFFGAVSAIPMEKFIKKVKATKDRPQMIKSHVWAVSLDKPERTAEEELFSQWLHEYPLHEHHAHWHGLERTTHREDKERADLMPERSTHEPEIVNPTETEDEEADASSEPLEAV